MSEKASLKSLANMLSANLILKSIERLDNSFKDISDVGKQLATMEKVAMEHMIKAISITAGNKKANLQLVKYINLFLEAKYKKYPYLPLIQKRKKQIVKAFNIANSSHHSDWESLIQESIIKAIGKNAVFENSMVIPKSLMNKLGAMQEITDGGETK